MKTRIHKGWAVVGLDGNIIAFTFDNVENQGSGTLVKLGFTNAEAQKTRDRVFRAELKYNIPSSLKEKEIT